MKIKHILKRLTSGKPEDLRATIPRFKTGCVIQVVSYSSMSDETVLHDENGIVLTVPMGSRLTYYVVDIRDLSEYNAANKGIEYRIAWMHNGKLLDKWDPLNVAEGQVVRTLKVYDTIEEMLSCDDEAARKIGAEIEGKNKFSSGAKWFHWRT